MFPSGTIGGSIGLAMGLSILTLVEFLFFIGDALQILVCGADTKEEEEPPSSRTSVNGTINEGADSVT